MRVEFGSGLLRVNLDRQVCVPRWREVQTLLSGTKVVDRKVDY